MIFSALVEFMNYCVGKSMRILGDDDDIWKSASYQIEQDLSKVRHNYVCCSTQFDQRGSYKMLLRRN